MHLNPHAVACAMRTKHNGVQGRRARSARYAECATAVCFGLDLTIPVKQPRCPSQSTLRSYPQLAKR